MKKNIFSVLVMLLAFCCLFVGCNNLVNNNEDSKDDNNDKETSVTAGWYEYTTNANSDYPQSTIMYINESGTIERAGSIDNEYSGQQLEMLQNQLSYAICKKNADGVVIIFVSTNEPIWANSSNDDLNNDKVCPYAEGEYLDISLYPYHAGYAPTEITWPINKNIPLWSKNIDNYKYSCSDVYGYINNQNIFIIGSYMEVGFTIRIEDEFSNYRVSITFIEAVNDNNSNDNQNETTLPSGYEWWCFEEADLQGDYYFLYFNNTLVRMGLYSKEFDIEPYLVLYGDKDYAISNFMGNKYKITDLTKLPAWALN